MSSTWGEHLKLSVFGESHGAAIGVVMDGLPAGLRLDTDEIDRDLKRRAPGGKAGSTKRRERDEARILSGFYHGYTTGTPLAAVIENTDMHSSDYSELITKPRPGHSDYAAWVKYKGFADIRGGGHFSGRLTAPIVFAGAVARALLKGRGITVGSHILSIGNAWDRRFETAIDAAEFEALRASDFPVIDKNVEPAMKNEIAGVVMAGDSVGGIVECAAAGLPAGIGGPLFGALECRIASILFSVPAVKGVEFGAGFEIASMHGSEANDAMYMEDGQVLCHTNHNGGITGGMTNGMPVVVRSAIKPTPSIAIKQDTVDLGSMSDTQLTINGRHDACIVPRALPVIEAAVMLALADAIMGE